MRLLMMTPEILIRDEVPDDVADICDVTVAAFESMEISNQTEQFVIDALCTVNALTLSLVAEVNGQVAGHIAFSPVTISDGTDNWYGPGPVSAFPAYQRKGIGSALIEEGLSRLKYLGAKGCCLVALGFPRVPDEFFFALSFRYPVVQGDVAFHEGFKATGS